MGIGKDYMPITRINEYLLNHKRWLIPLLGILWLSGMLLWLADIYTYWSIPIIVVAIVVNVYGWVLILLELAERFK